METPKEQYLRKENPKRLTLIVKHLRRRRRERLPSEEFQERHTYRFKKASSSSWLCFFVDPSCSRSSVQYKRNHGAKRERTEHEAYVTLDDGLTVCYSPFRKLGVKTQRTIGVFLAPKSPARQKKSERPR
jgi:hypothetical protein